MRPMHGSRYSDREIVAKGVRFGAFCVRPWILYSRRERRAVVLDFPRLHSGLQRRRVACRLLRCAAGRVHPAGAPQQHLQAIARRIRAKNRHWGRGFLARR